MRKIFFVSIMVLIAVGWSGCEKNEHILQKKELDKPSTMNVYCQTSPGTLLRRVEYEYNDNRLISETNIGANQEQNKTTYQYNDRNQLAKETYTTNIRKIEKTYFYNPKGQLIKIEYIITDLDANGNAVGTNESESIFEYENDLLVKEVEYWGGYNTYEYKNGQLYKKIDHTKLGQEHHMTYYTYSGGLLKEEKKVTFAGNTLYHKVYQYDSVGKLLKIKDGDDIIEENRYEGNKLIEKREYYFGIDPGYYSCYGNYIYTYEY